MNINEEVAQRHAQYQDGAITYSEFCNTIITLGIRMGQIVLTEGELHDVEGA
jgi:hypothetical protein